MSSAALAGRLRFRLSDDETHYRDALQFSLLKNRPAPVRYTRDYRLSFRYSHHFPLPHSARKVLRLEALGISGE